MSSICKLTHELLIYAKNNYFLYTFPYTGNLKRMDFTVKKSCSQFTVDYAEVC